MRQPILRFVYLLLTTLVSTTGAHARVEHHVVEDEFGNDPIHAVTIQSSENSISAVLMIRCSASKPTQVTLNTDTHTIYPDGTTPDDKYMYVDTKFKFDTNPEISEQPWVMHMTKYRTAILPGTHENFLDSAMKANKLAISHTSRSDVFRFSLKGTSAAISKLKKGCELDF